MRAEQKAGHSVVQTVVQMVVLTAAMTALTSVGWTADQMADLRVVRLVVQLDRHSADSMDEKSVLQKVVRMVLQMAG